MEDLAGRAGAEDERQWVSATEAAEMVHLCRKRVLRLTKERGYTRRQAHQNAPPFFLRQEIDSWADFRQLRRRGLAKYKRSSREKRWTEQIEVELAQRLFITSSEAAALLGVTRDTVNGMVQRGRLVCYQSVPGHSGSRLWFSRRAVLQLAEDPERLKRRENYLQGKADSKGSNRGGMILAQMVRGGIPKGWLTTREAARFLGVSPCRVREMRVTGKIRGEQIWRKNKPLRFWYFPDYEVERVISLREQVKELAGLLLVPLPLPPTPTPASGGGEQCALTPGPSPKSGGGESLLPTSASEGGEKEAPFVPSAGSPFRLDAEGPEPKWACDDADLTRAFFLLDRPGD